ncbi:MAG: ABC transporter permease [Candidatus Dormibacteria bacterium]
MLLLAFRNLFQSKAKLLMSTGGLALALLLVLALDAILVGSETQLTAYINHAGADVWVSQSGVRNMHMSSSTLPPTTLDQVRSVSGVAEVTPIQFLMSFVQTGSERHIVYVIGLPPEAAMGRPWKLSAGSAQPQSGQVVIDSSVAKAAGTHIGDTVRILDTPYRVTGLADGTANIVNSIAFISASDFTRMRGTADTVSYLLVRDGSGRSPEQVAGAIATAVPVVTVQTRSAFAASERRVVSDMVIDIANIMNATGLMIGLAVIALSIYTVTLSRRAEYGLLKAVGASNRELYGVVLTQSFIALVLGLGLSVAMVLALSLVVPLVRPSLGMELTAGSVVKVAAMALVIATVASVLPVRQIAHLDPASVFRRKL